MPPTALANKQSVANDWNLVRPVRKEAVSQKEKDLTRTPDGTGSMDLEREASVPPTICIGYIEVPGEMEEPKEKRDMIQSCRMEQY